MINILKFVVDYVIVGSFSVWMVNEGKVVKYYFIEFNSDKVVVQVFFKGWELVQEEGWEKEVMKVFSWVIDKYECYVKAYECCGFVNQQLCNYEDVIYDYFKSIDINLNVVEFYLGCVLVYIVKEDYVVVVVDLMMVIKGFIFLQLMFWQFCCIKGECYLKFKQWDKVEFELKFVIKWQFIEDDFNYKWWKWALCNYGIVLFE